MPLKDGNSDQIIGENIKTQMDAGCNQEQATIAAYKHAGRSNLEISLACATLARTDPAHSVPAAQNGFRAAAQRLGSVGK